MRVFSVHLTARESARLEAIAEQMDVPPFALGQEAVRAFIRTWSKPAPERPRRPRRPRALKATRERAREPQTQFDVLWTGSMKVTPAEALRKANA